MAPGIFRLRTACCTLVVPVRLALCLPLLICTLDAYSPHAALRPQGAPPTIPNGTHEVPATGGDGRTVPVYIALLPAAPPPPAQTGRALVLAFVVAAAALSVLGMLALWWSSDDPDDATLVDGERRTSTHRAPLLLLGTATRLLLGALGTIAMAQVVGERASIQRGSFIAIEVLGWLLV